MSENHRTRRAGNFYGRRKAKPLKKSQEVLVKELLPRLTIDLESSAPETLSELFAGIPKNIIMEIGFGGGEHLVRRSLEQPETGFIGCEPFVNGMAMALSSIDEQEISNIRLFDEDATRLLDWLPDSCVDIVYLLYPDPWPKKRHWKRRFVNDDNVARFARIIRPGGEFRFASDIDHYVNWTLQHLKRSDEFSWLARNSQDWIVPWKGWQSTRYEQKALREGRKSAYLSFVRNPKT